MNSIFSIDDFSDPFWEQPPPLNSESEKVVTVDEISQSQPEWTFEMFLEEISSSVSSEPVGNNAIIGVSSAQSCLSVSGQNDVDDDASRFYSRGRRDNDRDSGNWDCPPRQTVLVDSDDYHRVLKSKLETECVTAALSLRSGYVKPEDSTSSPETQFQPVQTSPSLQGSLMAPRELGVSSSLPAEVIKSGVPMKQVTSGSSREDSDDDDLDEENETAGCLNPEDVKRSRRMLSNRESARRSRRRKQEQTSELETQVGELKGEHSTLLKQLSNMNHKYDEAAVDNRILKADIETLRAKVKMAEETVKRVTGMNPLLLGRSNGHNNRMPLTGNRITSSCIPAFQLQSNINHLSNQQVPNIPIPIPNILPPRLENDFTGNTLVPPPSLNHQSTNPYNNTSPLPGWSTESSPHTVPQNDSAWSKKCVD